MATAEGGQAGSVPGIGPMHAQSRALCVVAVRGGRDLRHDVTRLWAKVLAVTRGS